MSRAKYLVLGVVAGLALSPAARAFQESQAGVASSQQSIPGVTVVQPGTPPVLLGDEPASAPSSSGIEVRIPGLGRLGVLPKFDFGLDLLYGVNQQGAETDRWRVDRPDDVRIGGSLRHRF
jgi:hypothetical protein